MSIVDTPLGGERREADERDPELLEPLPDARLAQRLHLELAFGEIGGGDVAAERRVAADLVRALAEPAEDREEVPGRDSLRPRLSLVGLPVEAADVFDPAEPAH